MVEITRGQMLVGAILVIVGFLLYFFIFIEGQPKPFIEIDALFDDDGNEITRGLSVVQNIEGVKFITLRVNIENKDKVPLNIRITDLTPEGLDLAIPTQKLKLSPGQTGTWITGKIDITPYEGNIQPFCATATSDEIFILRGENEITGCIDIDIKADPLLDGSFEVELDSSTGSNSINPSCEEDWTCTQWTNCINSVQTRTCSDYNLCGTENNKPTESQICQETSSCVEDWTCGAWTDCINDIQSRGCSDYNQCGTTENIPLTSRSCTVELPEEEPIGDYTFETNAIGGDYRKSIWIKINGFQYFTNPTTSSYDCSYAGASIFMETPEGYPICTRQGYEITQRVYLDDSQSGSVLFRP